jgi:dolichol-phosphate mannosyltransferase
MAESIWLVLPTYDERDTLATVVMGARAHMAAECEAFRVLIVDDHSPDGTGMLADRLAAEYPDVEVLHRPTKAGLGRAYVAGFERALRRGASYVVEMDADCSHDPADLPRLVAAIRAGADVVVGSRYVAGGAIERWGLLRQCVSRAGCWYARTLLGVPVRDLTSGFKCFRAQTLDGIDYMKAGSEGYVFQVELTYRALRRGCEVVEIPITFWDRRHGASKMSTRIAVEAAWRVPLLRWSTRLEPFHPCSPTRLGDERSRP